MTKASDVLEFASAYDSNAIDCVVYRHPDGNDMSLDASVIVSSFYQKTPPTTSTKFHRYQ